MKYVFAALGAAIALAGADKLMGQRGYEGMFRHLGWPPGRVRAVAAVETAGGLLMTLGATRRLGGAAVAGASAALLASEVRHGDGKLAAPRGLVLLAGLFALATPRGGQA